MLTGDSARLYSFVNTLRGLNADDRLARPMLDDWEGRIIAGTRLFDDALATMGRLRLAGKRLGIVTNGFTTMQSRMGDLTVDRSSGQIRASRYELSEIRVVLKSFPDLDRSAEVIRQILKKSHKEQDYSIHVTRIPKAVK